MQGAGAPERMFNRTDLNMESLEELLDTHAQDIGMFVRVRFGQGDGAKKRREIFSL
jgi:hypothetical protein